jgi:hypothetical protein
MLELKIKNDLQENDNDLLIIEEIPFYDKERPQVGACGSSAINTGMSCYCSPPKCPEAGRWG